MDIKITEGIDLTKLIAAISDEKKDVELINKYHYEFYELDRNQRETQIGKLQRDKVVKGKKVTAVRVPIALANKIVNTAVGFEFGEPVTLTPSIQNELSDQVLLDWKNARIDDKLIKAKTKQKQETQAALLFYFKDLKPDSLINRIAGVNKNRSISAKVLDCVNSESFYPYFDETGDMKFFVHLFSSNEIDDDFKLSKVNHCWIYDEENVHKIKKEGSKWNLTSSDKHGFSKIPVVYMSQPKPEHYLVKEAIDRLEVCISRLGASNDYSGHPILFIEGEIYGLPDKESDGKVMRTSVEINEDGKKTTGGDAKFLTHDNAPESVKLEIEKLEGYIYHMTGTPNLSFEMLKGMGTVATRTLEFMLLDSNIKKLNNQGQNRTDVERCINIIISGIITTSKASLKSQANNLVFDIEFGNILPNNFDELVDTVAKGVASGVISKETAIEMLGVTEDFEEELKRINNINKQNNIIK